jgi:hypothetical protein
MTVAIQVETKEATMAKTFKRGDEVRWNTPQGKTRGKVVRKLTADTSVKGTDVKASEDDPRYLVESEKSGEHAAHKPDALERA